MIFKRLLTKDDLADHFDDLVKALWELHHKTGTITDSPDRVLSSIIKWIGTPQCFLLIVCEGEIFKGFMYAVCVQCGDPWVEVVAMWSPPGVASKLREEVLQRLKVWSEEQGAKRIVTIITRSPENFYEMFYKPLGFKTVGLVLEVDVDV